MYDGYNDHSEIIYFKYSKELSRVHGIDNYSYHENFNYISQKEALYWHFVRLHLSILLGYI